MKKKRSDWKTKRYKSEMGQIGQNATKLDILSMGRLNLPLLPLLISWYISWTCKKNYNENYCLEKIDFFPTAATYASDDEGYTFG